MALNFRNYIVLFFCLLLAALSSPASADTTASLAGEAPAIGIGLEISHGDYGAGADATLVALPLRLFFSGYGRMDATLEVPLLFLSSRADSGVVVTTSGGFGRGRAAGRGSTAATTAATVRETGVGDINATAGWTLVEDGEKTPRIRPTISVKLPTGNLDRGLGTGTYEAGPGFSISKWIGKVQVFGEGAYIFQDSEPNYPGRNYASYLGGAGIQATDRLFVSLFVKGSSARAQGADSQAEGRLKVNFIQSRRIAWEMYGSAGFTDASPDIGGGIMMTYQF